MRNPLQQDTFLFYCGRETPYPDIFIRVTDRPVNAWIKMNKLCGNADYQMFHYSEVDIAERTVKDINDIIVSLGGPDG